MLLGERLKEIRNSLGLNQTQMTEGIINRSFYSRVEKGENSMSTQELMRLLYPHGVSMIEFCQGFGNTEPQIEVYQEAILRAYLDRDVDALEQIYHKGNFADTRIKNFIILLASELEGRIDEAKEIIKNDPSYNCLQGSYWNEENLWFTFFIMDLYNLDQLQNLIDIFFNRYHAKDIDERTMQLASRILVRYLDICFKQDQRNDEMNKAIELLKLLPNKVEFGGYKILATYYEQLLDGNYENVQLIIDLLKSKDLDYR